MALLMSLGMSAQQSKYSHTIQAEKLDRGVIARLYKRQAL